MTAGRGGAAALLIFALLATANAGGYRYGASDHAFYAAAIAERADPSLFPRDTPLLQAQARLWVGDDLIGGLARVTGLDLPPLFFAIYGVTLVALFAAGVAYMRALGGSMPATAAFLLLLTFRHRIARTGANTLEGYMHPRILAFAIGVGALAAIVRERPRLAVLLVAVAAVLHTTTALWFGLVVLIVIGQASLRPRHVRAALPWIALLTIVAIGAGAWAFLAGPLAGRLAVMDPAWLSVLASKDYLFPAQWPLYAWVANLAYPGVLVLIYRARAARGLSGEGERALVVALLGLVAIFLISVPFTMLRVALAVQMQVNRVFWVLDVAVAAYLAWWLTEVTARRSSRAQWAIVGTLLALSIARGAYIIGVEGQRALVQIRPAGEWIDAMAWIRRQPEQWHVLADPQHAWKYGISVRVAALRDTLLEDSKDTALAMYDRGIAMRVAERRRALADFDTMAAPAVRALAARYGLDVLVVERPRTFEFPRLFENARFTVYDLR